MWTFRTVDYLIGFYEIRVDSEGDVTVCAQDDDYVTEVDGTPANVIAALVGELLRRNNGHRDSR